MAGFRIVGSGASNCCRDQAKCGRLLLLSYARQRMLIGYKDKVACLHITASE